MFSKSTKEQEQADGSIRHATFITSEYLLGAFALAVGIFLAVTVNPEIISLPTETLLELALFAIIVLLIVVLYWINSALSFIGETRRSVLRFELDEAISEAETMIKDNDSENRRIEN
jgi:hypothetical protein